MAYFAREDTRRKASPPRRGGKHVGGAKDIPAGAKDIPTRDGVIEENIARMQRDADANSGAGVLRFVSDRESKAKATRSQHHKPDSDIFGPPVEGSKPTPRIRTGVSDDELKRIWAEDERKASAAAKMQNAPTMVDRMVAEPVNPVMPSSRAKDAVPAPRKQLEMLSETQAGRNREANEPSGFGGMGRQSQPHHRTGVSCKPAPAFEAPELIHKPRTQGRRVVAPTDQFSFNDGSNQQ